MVPPACEKIKLMSRYFCDAPLNIRLAMVRVVSVPNSIDRRADLGHQVDAAVGVGRVGVDHGLAAVELLQDRREVGMAEPLVAVARHHADAVDLERVEGVGDLLQGLVDVRQRQRGEQRRSGRDDRPSSFVGVFVDFARDADRRRRCRADVTCGVVGRGRWRSRRRPCPCRRAIFCTDQLSDGGLACGRSRPWRRARSAATMW